MIPTGKAPLSRSTSGSGFHLLDLIGIGLFVTFVCWTLFVGQQTGRDPLPMALLVTATGLAAFAARSLTRLRHTAAPVLLLLVLSGAIAVTWPAAIDRHFGLTGYSNANGALYVVGVGAAGLIVLRSRSPVLRLVAATAGLALAALPWFFQAEAAALGALVVVAAVVVLMTVRDVPRRTVSMLGAGVAVLVLVGTIGAGVLYDGDGQGEGGGRLTERRLVLWSESVDILLEHPGLGVGPGGFAQVSPTALADRDARWAHHAPLHVGAETGVVGLGLLLAILVWAFAWLHAGSGRRGAALATIVLSLGVVHASIDFVWHYPAVTVGLATLVGAGASAGRSTAR